MPDYSRKFGLILGLLCGPPLLHALISAPRAWAADKTPVAFWAWRKQALTTANGGPGWAKAPKPEPRRTVKKKLKERLGSLAEATRRKLQETGDQIKKYQDSLITGVIYSIVAVILLVACYYTTVWLYLRKQQPLSMGLRDKGGITAAANDGMASSTDSRVEKISNDSQPDSS